VAAQAEAELEPLIAAYLVEEDVRDPEMDALLREVGPMAAETVPDTSDDELHAAAATFRDAAARTSAGEAQPAGLGDAWDRFLETDANFVTPGDLHHMTPIAEVQQLP
jgi:hypothetical protein